ncbi:Piso0_004546 [Millerozyma farinosa CBS 7064]|uniref:Piso0_004546 protein n=1 Tax=Pichia sorbitophila (strain ATCC MYA-4447 / BCRC 22081 / CBS 7064 / NBRC 10061 / NRRL Y-12695) TaxID=559304 RepID=G8Y5R9_PICSO|nr:Piso0_004546 [Millerozyma farinosa CBS 7064]CCE84980.1 Piso0_004546 [Millerozyma farinosa CBS 7064]
MAELFKESEDQIVHVCGHRGFKAKYTENTVHAFEKCFETGAGQIETDLWITKDKELVVSHDASTKRIFCDKEGNPTDKFIPKVDFDEIRDFKTIESGERIMRFEDLMHWFIGYSDRNPKRLFRVMLDIKKGNKPAATKLIVQKMLELRPDLQWWVDRVHLGIWDLRVARFLNQDPFFQEVYEKYGPTSAPFDVFHISISWEDSMHYLDYNDYLDDTYTGDRWVFKVSGVSLLYLSTWSCDFLHTFLPRLEEQNSKLFCWTINRKDQLNFVCQIRSASSLPFVGVITDSPDVMIDALEQHDIDKEHRSEYKTTSSTRLIAKDAIHLTFNKKIFNKIFTVLTKLLSPKRVTIEETKFNSEVDGEYALVFKPSKISTFVFSSCQKLGLF